MRGVLIFGCGYTGKALARFLVQRGIPVWGTTRSESGKEAISKTGALPILFGEESPTLPPEILEKIDTVVNSIGPDWVSGRDVTPLVQKALFGASLKRFVYVSSTSVFGDAQGAWVDETSPCDPSAEAGKRRVRIESSLWEWARSESLPLIVARVSGIYGPTRSLLHRIVGGRYRMVKGANSFSNRIHVEDLARCLGALCERGAGGETYILSDQEPALSHEVAEFALSLLGEGHRYDVISLEEALATYRPSHMAMIQESKRLSNAKIGKLLDHGFLYPTFREGLQSIASQEWPAGS